MTKDYGGREPFLVEAKACSIVLGQREREIIQETKGDLSMSELVRRAIRGLTDNSDSAEHNKVLREKDALIRSQAKELETLKKLVVDYMDQKGGR